MLIVFLGFGGYQTITVTAEPFYEVVGEGLESESLACEAAFEHWYGQWPLERITTVYVPTTFPLELLERYSDSQPPVVSASVLADSPDDARYVWTCTELETNGEGEYLFTVSISSLSTGYRVTLTPDGWQVQRVFLWAVH